MDRELKEKMVTPDQIETLKTCTFFEREKENFIYPISLACLVLHGIDQPHIWQGNTLRGVKLMVVSFRMPCRCSMAF